MVNSPTLPQCCVKSPFRWAAFPLMKTVALPVFAFHMFGPQQAIWIPGSPTRNAGNSFTMTSGDPWIPGPMTGCGQAGQPCLSAWAFARSLTRPCGGISSLLAGLDHVGHTDIVRQIEGSNKVKRARLIEDLIPQGVYFPISARAFRTARSWIFVNFIFFRAYLPIRSSALRAPGEALARGGGFGGSSTRNHASGW
jgi:hypothetical protein